MSDRVLSVIIALAVLLGIGTAGAALAFTAAQEIPPNPVSAVSTTSPSPSPSPEPEYVVETATPEPADPLLAVTAIVVRPDRLDLVDADGSVIRELSYDDETDAVVEALTSVLGQTPSVEEFSGDAGVSAQSYAWPGLVISDDLRSGPGHLPTNVSVSFERPTLGDGVTVRTTAGFAPGDDLAAFSASVGRAYSPDGGENLIPLETGPELGPSPVPGAVNALAVAGRDLGASGAGSTVFAPFNFGREQGAG